VGHCSRNFLHLLWFSDFRDWNEGSGRCDGDLHIGHGDCSHRRESLVNCCIFDKFDTLMTASQICSLFSYLLVPLFIQKYSNISVDFDICFAFGTNQNEHYRLVIMRVPLKLKIDRFHYFLVAKIPFPAVTFCPDLSTHKDDFDYNQLVSALKNQEITIDNVTMEECVQHAKLGLI
jgi:hypothetical protein